MTYHRWLWVLIFISPFWLMGTSRIAHSSVTAGGSVNFVVKNFLKSDSGTVKKASVILYDNSNNKIDSVYTGNSNEARFSLLITSVDQTGNPLPQGFTLHQNYPNPFNPSTQIEFEISRSDRVMLDIYNTLGQKVKTLAAAELETGTYRVTWFGDDDQGRTVASGVYLYRLLVGQHQIVKKMINLGGGSGESNIIKTISRSPGDNQFSKTRPRLAKAAQVYLVRIRNNPETLPQVLDTTFTVNLARDTVLNIYLADRSQGFLINMPILLSDTASIAYGIWPFGVHGSSHAFDGHPGWDVEYKVGTSVRAAADGTVQSVFTDSNSPDKKTIQLQHSHMSKVYRTVYTNIGTVAGGIVPGATVTAGQPIGIAGSQTIYVGPNPTPFAMTHFQLDDFSGNSGITNPNAVTPESYLNPGAKTIFEAIWKRATYNQELCEPFPANPRDVTFPFTRIWRLQSGIHPARIDFRRPDPTTNDYDYTLFDANDIVIETGTVQLQPTGSSFSRIDLRPSAGGPPRLGLYDIVSDTMRIRWSDPGATRPGDLSNASIYTTH